MSSSRHLREYGSGSSHSHSHSSLSPPSSSSSASPSTASFIASASLPRDGDDDDAAAAAAAAARAASVDAVHVLAVDDSFVDRKVIEKLLKHSSYKVTTVDSGRRALEILGLAGEDQLHDDEINLIITDYCMPGMSGYDLLKAIKESSALKEIPVVVMSSENVPHRINRCLAEGAEEFLLKPVKLADVKRLRGHVRHQQQQQQQLRNQGGGDDDGAAERPDGSSRRGTRISTRTSFFS